MPSAPCLAPLWSALLAMLPRCPNVKTLEFNVGGLTDMGSSAFDSRDFMQDGPLAHPLVQGQGTLVFMMQDFLQDQERMRGWWYHVGDGQCIARHFLGLPQYKGVSL